MASRWKEDADKHLKLEPTSSGEETDYEDAQGVAPAPSRPITRSMRKRDSNVPYKKFDAELDETESDVDKETITEDKEIKEQEGLPRRPRTRSMKIRDSEVPDKRVGFKLEDQTKVGKDEMTIENDKVKEERKAEPHRPVTRSRKVPDPRISTGKLDTVLDIKLEEETQSDLDETVQIENNGIKEESEAESQKPVTRSRKWPDSKVSTKELDMGQPKKESSIRRIVVYPIDEDTFDCPLCYEVGQLPKRKICAYLIYLCIFFLGLICTAVALYAFLDLSVFEEHYKLGMLHTSIVFNLILGGVLVLMSIIGFIGRRKGFRTCAYIFEFFLLIATIIFLYIGLINTIKQDTFMQHLSLQINDTMLQYQNKSSNASLAVDAIQKEYHCCGIHDYNNWKSIFKISPYVPESCCLIPVMNYCFLTVDALGKHPVGCLSIPIYHSVNIAHTAIISFLVCLVCLIYYGCVLYYRRT